MARATTGRITNSTAIDNIKKAQEILLDLSLILSCPYTRFIFLQCIISRTRSIFYEARDSADARTKDGVISNKEGIHEDPRLIKLCALLVLSRQTLRLAGEDADVFFPPWQNVSSIDAQLPIARVFRLEDHIVPHDEMKALFDRTLNNLGHYVKDTHATYEVDNKSSPVSADLLYSLSIAAVKHADYTIASASIGLITETCIASLEHFLSVERSMNWMSTFIKSLFHRIVKDAETPSLDIAEATILLLNRIVIKLHDAAREKPFTRSRKDWINLAFEVHFATAWFIRFCLSKFAGFEPNRIHEICMSFIGTILPPSGSAPATVGFTSWPGSGSASPSGQSPPVSPQQHTSILSSNESKGEDANTDVPSTPPLDITKTWWKERKFGIIIKQYVNIARPSDNGILIPQLLQALNISPDDLANGIRSAQPSPGTDSYNQAHESPLGTPAINSHTPSILPSASPSASPSPFPANSPLSSSDGATPRSDHANASPYSS